MATESGASSGSTDLVQDLSGIRAMLEADGYDLHLDNPRDDASIALRITAAPNACEDCLVPKDLMKNLISDSLNGAIPPDAISVRYPGE